MSRGKTRRRRVSPVQFIVLSFLGAIVCGTLLLLLPFSQRPGVHLGPLDALFTATSAVCVTGLTVADTAETFSVFGRIVIALLIQLGGLGIASTGIALIMLTGRRIDIRGQRLINEALNHRSFKGVLSLVRWVLLITVGFELAGAAASFVIFVQDMPPLRALGVAVFHSIASFNNAGFDILGGGASLAPYADNLALNLITSVLVICGGLGFFVLRDLYTARRWRRLSLHSKVVLVTTGALLLGGTLLLRLTDHLPWDGAFFMSMSARTAGFTLYPLVGFSHAGLLVLCLLMLVGASPGSTGGGVKTTTLFVLIRAVSARTRNRNPAAFRRSLPQELIYKSFVLVLLAVALVFLGAFLLCLAEPEQSFSALLFEAFSAFGTVGLSAGLTPSLGTAGRIVLIPLMYIGRLGPLTIATLWSLRASSGVVYAEEQLPIG